MYTYGSHLFPARSRNLMLVSAEPQEVGTPPESRLFARDKLWINVREDHALGIMPLSILFLRNKSWRLVRAPQLGGRGPVRELTFR